MSERYTPWPTAARNPEPEPAMNWPLAGVAVAAGFYFLWCAVTPETWRLLDGVNLLVHEAGHFVFAAFGEFMTIAGGSLMQVIMPALFVGYFVREGKLYSAGLVAMWVGQSMANVATYAGDAVVLNLNLLGGPDTIHDWNWLLTRTGTLAHVRAIAFLIRACAIVTILVGTVLAVYTSRGQRSESIE